MIQTLRHFALPIARVAAAATVVVSVGMLTPHSLVWCVPAAPSDQSAHNASAVEGNPQSVEFNERGVAAVQGKDTRLAEELFRKAIEADSKNLTAVFNLAGMLLTNGKEAQGIALLESYTREFEGDAGLWARLGDAYFTSKDLKGAERAYLRAWELDRTMPKIASKLGTLYTLTNQLKKAEEMLLAAVEESPRDQQLLSNLSSVFLANGNSDRAISTARRAIQLKPTKELYVTLGTAYELTKDYDNSLIAFQRARDLGDKRPELTAKIEALTEHIHSRANS